MFSYFNLAGTLSAEERKGWRYILLAICLIAPFIQTAYMYHLSRLQWNVLDFFLAYSLFAIVPFLICAFYYKTHIYDVSLDATGRSPQRISSSGKTENQPSLPFSFCIAWSIVITACCALTFMYGMQSSTFIAAAHPTTLIAFADFAAFFLIPLIFFTILGISIKVSFDMIAKDDNQIAQCQVLMAAMAQVLLNSNDLQAAVGNIKDDISRVGNMSLEEIRTIERKHLKSQIDINSPKLSPGQELNHLELKKRCHLLRLYLAYHRLTAKEKIKTSSDTEADAYSMYCISVNHTEGIGDEATYNHYKTNNKSEMSKFKTQAKSAKKYAYHCQRIYYSNPAVWFTGIVFAVVAGLLSWLGCHLFLNQILQPTVPNIGLFVSVAMLVTGLICYLVHRSDATPMKDSWDRFVWHLIWLWNWASFVFPIGYAIDVLLDRTFGLVDARQLMLDGHPAAFWLMLGTSICFAAYFSYIRYQSSLVVDQFNECSMYSQAYIQAELEQQGLGPKVLLKHQKQGKSSNELNKYLIKTAGPGLTFKQEDLTLEQQGQQEDLPLEDQVQQLTGNIQIMIEQGASLFSQEEDTTSHHNAAPILPLSIP